ncbi:MAG: DUF3592 domain-containing protein [Lentisphaeria bacterium]|nr:DUF3592 domain-containing protein [Lentisphaeria bacterium]
MGWWSFGRKTKSPSRKNPAFYGDVAEFLANFYKVSGKTKIVYCVLAVFMLIMSAVTICQELSWNHKIKTFVTVRGTILKNNIRRVRRGKGSRNISDLEYIYTYRGRSYTGNRIVYGKELYPRQYQKGSLCPILVNPSRPSESAAMLYYRGFKGVIARCFHLFIFLVFSLGFLIAFFLSLRSRKIIVPEKLRMYLAQFPEEEVLQAQSEARNPCSMPARVSLSTVSFSRKVRFRCMERYMLVGGSVFPWGFFMVSGILCMGVILLCVTGNSIFLLHILIMELISFFILCPAKLVLDLHEKRICSCRIFFTEKITPEKSISFEEIDFLYLMRNDAGKNQPLAWCCARLKDGSGISLLQITVPEMVYFLEFLPELAGRLGNRKILFFRS